MIYKDLKELKERELQDMKNMLKKAIEKIDDLEKKARDNENEITELRTEIQALRRAENNSKLEIINLNESKEEKLEERVINLAKRYNLIVKPEDISYVYRLPIKKERRPVIIKFTRQATKEALYKARKNAKVESDGQQVYINEHTTKEERILLAKAKSKAKEESWKFVWVKNGRIMARKDENKDSKILNINKEEDLNKIK